MGNKTGRGIEDQSSDEDNPEIINEARSVDECENAFFKILKMYPLDNHFFTIRNVKSNSEFQLEEETIRFAKEHCYKMKFNNEEKIFSMISSYDICDYNIYEIIMEEIKIIKKFSHPNLLKIEAGVLEYPALGFICEYCEHYKGIKEYMKNKEFPPIPVAKKIEIIRCIVDVFDYFGDIGFIFQSFSSDNVLLDKDLVPKVVGVGFGLKVESLKEKSVSNDFKVYIKHCSSPETRKNGEYSSKSDVFSLANFIFEILTEDSVIQEPDDDEDESDDNDKDEEGEERRKEKDEKDNKFGKDLRRYPVGKQECLEWILEIVERCWNEDPDGRPTCAEIKDLIDQNLETTREGIRSFDEDNMGEYVKGKE